MAGTKKIRALDLSEGDSILVVRDTGRRLQAARKVTGAVVATVTERPAKTPSPEKGRRAGYRIVTSEGVIGFVTSVQGIIPAPARDQERQGHRGDAQGVLDGVAASAAGRTQVVEYVDPTSAVESASSRRAAAFPDGVMAPGAPAPVAPSGQPLVPVSQEMVENYRAQSRASTTKKAKDFWNRKAHEAAKGRVRG